MKTALKALAVAPPVERRRAASKARYAASPKGRATAARYEASAKGRARSARYNRSDRGARRAIVYNRTTKGRARSERFERTAHRRQYKALSYLFGSPYKDLEVTAVLAENRNQPLITQGLRFTTISVKCMCFKCRWRKSKATRPRRRGSSGRLRWRADGTSLVFRRGWRQRERDCRNDRSSCR